MGIDSADDDETRRAIRLAAILVLLVCVAGVAGIWAIGKLELWRRSMFYEQFATEGPGIAILAAGAIAMLVLAGRPVSASDFDTPAWLKRVGSSRIVLAITVLLIVRVGAALVFHDYALVDDEYSGLFQAKIYANGHGTATVAQPWCQWISALMPTTIVANGCTWSVGYFPVNALIRGGFMAFHLNSLAHPAIAAITVLFLIDICRRLWPAEPERAVVAALFLAASTQFLMMSMTAFSMPAHLLASTIWLWLYVRPERWALIVLPWVGVVALGVHSPYPHALFAIPFILRYVAERRYLTFAYFSVVYIAGAIALVTFFYSPGHPADAATAMASAQSISSTAGGFFGRPRGEPIYAALSAVVLGAWNLPIALVCVLVALLMWKRLDPITRWIGASLFFSLAVRALWFTNYGAGWGNRIVHAELTNFAVLGAVGVSLIARSAGSRRTYRMLGGSVIAALLFQLPLRGWRAAQIIRPYERASAYLATVPADVVILQFQSLQWGRQLLRNDPFLRNSPKLMDLGNLTPAQRDSLERRFPGRVRYVRPEEITALGVKPTTRIGRFEIR